MNKFFLSMIAVSSLVAGAAFAEEKAAEAPKTEVKVEAPATTQAELKDGTKIEISGDSVSVIGADGSKTPAPDGTHTLKDGTTVTTKDGKKV